MTGYREPDSNTIPPSLDSPPPPLPEGGESLFNLVGQVLLVIAGTAAVVFAGWSVAAWLLTGAWPWEFQP